jgi:hypothetical protein
MAEVVVALRGYRLRPLVDMLNDNLSRDDKEAVLSARITSPVRWPQGWAGWWKPKLRRENLVRAGALIIAEIERLDRASRRNA